MKKIIELNQLMSLPDKDHPENFQSREKLNKLGRPMGYDLEDVKRTAHTKKEKTKEAASGALGFKFLDFLQTEKNFIAGMPVQNSGTLNEAKLLKDRERKIKSTFKIEFKTAGLAEVMVYQTKGEYEVIVAFDDPAKIGSNPILFKNLIEKQLQEKLGVTLKLKVC